MEPVFTGTGAQIFIGVICGLLGGIPLAVSTMKLITERERSRLAREHGADRNEFYLVGDDDLVDYTVSREGRKVE
jgi:hypothetical protein